VIFSGAFPRELSDIIAMAILDLTTIQLVFSQTRFFSGLDASWILLLLVPLTCVLAAMSNSPNREREELALVAYGGSASQIELRYLLRGGIITTLGVLPLILQSLASTFSISTVLVVLVFLVVLGGSTYTIPVLRRTHSLSFVEQYKG
jgi:hypothetical protein